MTETTKEASCEYREAPPGFNAQPHVLNALQEAKHHVAMFFTKGELVGSGTFVNAWGFEGILTAFHVARNVLKEDRFALCIDENENNFWLSSNDFEEVVVGWPKRPSSNEGPDLSFLAFRNLEKLNQLRSKKSFFHLASLAPSRFDDELIKHVVWVVAGTPQDGCKRAERRDAIGRPIVRLLNVLLPVTFKERTLDKNGFDYVRLEIPTGADLFALRDGETALESKEASQRLFSYVGMSGGGIWLISFRFTRPGDDSESITYQPPLLAGVQFHQSGRKEENGRYCRTLTGHGFDSIYSRLRHVLALRPAPESQSAPPSMGR